MIPSAGTKSPVSKKTISFGTTSDLWICCFFPDLMTLTTTSSVIFSSVAAAFLDLPSVIFPIRIPRTTAMQIPTPSLYSPTKKLIPLAINKMTIKGSLKMSRNSFNSPRSLGFENSFVPYCFRCSSTCSSVKPVFTLMLRWWLWFASFAKGLMTVTCFHFVFINDYEMKFDYRTNLLNLLKI